VIRNGFEVLFCTEIHGDNDVEPFASSFFDVKGRNPALDLRNRLILCQCPMSSIRIQTTNSANTKWSRQVGCDDVVYAEVSSHGVPLRTISEIAASRGLDNGQLAGDW
jgi:hypothetical protein